MANTTGDRTAEPKAIKAETLWVWVNIIKMLSEQLAEFWKMEQLGASPNFILDCNVRIAYGIKMAHKEAEYWARNTLYGVAYDDFASTPFRQQLERGSITYHEYWQMFANWHAERLIYLNETEPF